ncbi:MAG: sigma 54-interacting transcriptional regulator, partial [Gammaproteobacteria bacterium]|nr:sigma 54-interacting transcriptional regulator [Gammaproteobacteria bacterium]
MVQTPLLYIVDEQTHRSSRLSTVLHFINEAHQLLTVPELEQRLSTAEPAVVLLGAITQQEHASLIQRYPATAFLLLGEGLTPLLQYANAVGLLAEPFAYAPLTQLLRDSQQYHRLLPLQRQETPAKFAGMVGNSDSMAQVRFLIAQVAKTDANVLVLGPSGTGKEVVARNIHLLSNR